MINPTIRIRRITAPTITAAMLSSSVPEKYAPRIRPRAPANRNASRQRIHPEHLQIRPGQHVVLADCTLTDSDCAQLALGV
jgi:hypothetical protein